MKIEILEDRGCSPRGVVQEAAAPCVRGCCDPVRPSCNPVHCTQAVVTTFSDNYPERLAAVYMYPAGSLASGAARP